MKTAERSAAPDGKDSVLLAWRLVLCLLDGVNGFDSEAGYLRYWNEDAVHEARAFVEQLLPVIAPGHEKTQELICPNSFSLYFRYMDLVATAKKILVAAEEDLRKLASAAIEKGEYDQVETLTEWARGVGRLVVASNYQQFKPAIPSPLPPKSVPGSNENTSKEPEQKVVQEGDARKVEARRSIRSQKDRYPVFLRDGEVLVKIGWSKTTKAEYEHRATKEVLNAFSKLLDDHLAKQRTFTMEELTDQGLVIDEQEVPSYQLYLCLAWLVSEEIIEKLGRKGYRLPRGRKLVEAVNKAWEALPTPSAT